ncbi:unnamed protein product, partial [Brassica oleracea]
PRNGVLVVHQNETLEERIRRLKGKAIEIDNQENTPTSLAKSLNTHGQHGRGGTLVIHNLSQQAPQSNMYPLLPMTTDSTGEDDELDIDKVMETENLDDMEFTKEDEAEVDRMVDEFNDVAMDETML